MYTNDGNSVLSQSYKKSLLEDVPARAITSQLEDCGFRFFCFVNFSKIGLKTHSTMAMLSRSVLRLTGVLRAQPAFAVAKRMVTTDLSLEDEKAQFPSPPRRALLYLPGTLKLNKNTHSIYTLATDCCTWSYRQCTDVRWCYAVFLTVNQNHAGKGVPKIPPLTHLLISNRRRQRKVYKEGIGS